MGSEQQFVICIENEGYPASLELWKVYHILPDAKASQHSMLRIVDESGEDYLYPAASFVPIQLPNAVAEAMLARA
jgi:hypothetical protein